MAARRYEEHFHTAVLPELRAVPGFRMAYLMRRDDGDGDSGDTVQRVDGYRAPEWPGQDVPQQFHLDFGVVDLEFPGDDQRRLGRRFARRLRFLASSDPVRLPSETTSGGCTGCHPT